MYLCVLTPEHEQQTLQGGSDCHDNDDHAQTALAVQLQPGRDKSSHERPYGTRYQLFTSCNQTWTMNQVCV